MTKSIITWAVAAMLAIPAVPMFAKTAAKKLTTHGKTHKTLIHTGKKHRTLHHTKPKHTLLSSARAGRHLSASLKHTAKPTASVRRSSTAAHPEVHVTSPVTIDGMHA